MVSKPVREVFSFWFLVFSWDWRAGRRHSRISVLLPEPLTPVTRTRRPKGKLTVMFLRLFFAAWCRVSQAECRMSGVEGEGFRLVTSAATTGRRWPRAGYDLCERRHLPVM